MMQQTISQATCDPSDVLRPIRVGVVAQQPDPDLQDVIYVGLAGLIPAHLRVLCSCAGLFYARVLVTDGDRYRMEVAALSHYFDAPARTRNSHVRTITIAHDDFARLIEYDRSVARKATSDVRELVEEHDAALTRFQRVALLKVDNTTLPAHTIEQQPLIDDAHLQRNADEEKEEVDLEILTQVFVPRAVIRETFAAMHITANRERRVHTALLVAALDTIKMQLDSPLPLKKRASLEREHQEIRAVQRWRRQRRTEGYGWQRVVTLVPGADGGGWDLVIGRPAA